MRPAATPNAPVTVLSLPDGRDLAFAEYGDADGLPVMAFHGTPGSHLQLAPAASAAEDSGLRLIVPDRPGYGHSSFVPRRRLADWPDDVAAIADHLGIDRFAVVGVSGGGPHALACAALLPHRVRAVSVVSSPSPQATGALRWLRTLGVAHLVVMLVMAVVLLLMRWYPSAMLGALRRWMPEADRRVVDHIDFRSAFVDAARRASPGSARAAAQDVSRFVEDWQLALEAIDSPVAIWHGADDEMVEPSNADVLATAMPGASVTVVPDEGHLLFATHTEEIFDDLVAAASGGELTETASGRRSHRNEHRV